MFNKNSKNEFLEFLNSKPMDSNNLDDQFPSLLSKIQNYESKSIKSYFIVHFISGFLTLSICPQFGLGPIGGGHGITHYVMQFGTWACGIFCAVFYFSISQILTKFYLKQSDLNSNLKLSHSITLISLSYFVLMSMGYLFTARDIMFFNLEFHIFWIISAFAYSLIPYFIQNYSTK